MSLGLLIGPALAVLFAGLMLGYPVLEAVRWFRMSRRKQRGFEVITKPDPDKAQEARKE